jgi:hypothetical protein
MFRKLLMIGGFVLAFAFSTGIARADTLTATFNGSSCAGCPSGTYTLTVTGDFSTGTNLTVTLTIQTSATATITSADSYISAVAFNLGEGSGLSAATISGAPGTLSDWLNHVNTNASNNNCSGGGAGWDCADVVSSGAWTDAAVTQGGTLTWTWTGVNIGGALNTDTSTWSLQVKYNNSTGTTNGLLISESPVGAPEPGTLVLLGMGLIPLFGIGRRLLL